MSLDLSHEPGQGAVVAGTRSHRRHVVETWEIVGSAGHPVLVDVHLPRDVRRVVVMGHGADNNRSARYVEVAGKSFTRRGTAVVAMDAPLHGDRRGAGGMDRLPGLLPSILEEWVRDHRVLLDVVTDRWPEIPIGFAGFSMGGLFGVPLMAVDARIGAGAVVIAGSTRISYPARLELSAEDRAALDLTDPAVHASAVDCPVLVLAAEHDEIVPVRAAEALVAAFAGPTEFVVLPGTHEEWGRAAEWFRTIEDFFVRALG